MVLCPSRDGAFERSAHEIDIADAFKSVVGAADLIGTAFGHIDEMSHEIGGVRPD